LAWGTADSESSHADGEDHINWFDISNNKEGIKPFGTYPTEPPAGLEWANLFKDQSNGLGPIPLFHCSRQPEHPSQGMGNEASTNLNLSSLAASLRDEIEAIELRYNETLIPPRSYQRQYLHQNHLPRPNKRAGVFYSKSTCHSPMREKIQRHRFVVPLILTQ